MLVQLNWKKRNCDDYDDDDDDSPKRENRY